MLKTVVNKLHWNPTWSHNIFRKRREETGSDPNYFSHYVHKDGFFQKDRQDLLIHILRSGSSREKGKFHGDFFFFHDFIFSSVILEKQGEVTEAREQLMQEKGAQVREHSIFCSYVLCYVSCFVKFLQGQSHYDHLHILGTVSIGDGKVQIQEREDTLATGGGAGKGID